MSGSGRSSLGCSERDACRILLVRPRDMTRFSAIHGSISAVVVFLLWVYVSAVILLYGVEFTAAHARCGETSAPVTRRSPAAPRPACRSRRLLRDHGEAPDPAGFLVPYNLDVQPVGCRAQSLPAAACGESGQLAWGHEAFAEAASQDRPIFLSIGYSTCHWCHVMAHECVRRPCDRGVAERVLHLDQGRSGRASGYRPRAMTFVQATTGSGGWPMSVWLTPDLKPFYGGTHFHRRRAGASSFAEILREIGRVWTEQRAQVQTSAETLTERIRGMRLPPQGTSIAGPAALTEGVSQVAQTFDQARGGFGDAPKFPRPSELLFLLREAARTGDQAPTRMVARTMQAMALGGMRDHVGGGFHRYSVDAEWRVPHFEKMLYDQSQLVLACLET